MRDIFKRNKPADPVAAAAGNSEDVDIGQHGCMIQTGKPRGPTLLRESDNK